MSHWSHEAVGLGIPRRLVAQVWLKGFTTPRAPCSFMVVVIGQPLKAPVHTKNINMEPLETTRLAVLKRSCYGTGLQVPRDHDDRVSPGALNLRLLDY